MRSPSLFQDAIRSLPELVSDHLRDAILTGALGPGQALRQEQIATDLGVSRAPVREALKLLESEGLIVLRPRRGYIVAALDPDEIEEIFDIRMLLEERAGYHATVNRSAEDVAAVEDILHKLDEITDVRPESITRWAALNRSFHTRLFESSGRQHLCRMTNMLRTSVERYVRADAAMAGGLEHAQHEHREIVAAFRAGNAKLVGKLSRQHCEHTRNRLIASIRERADQSAVSTG